MGTFFGFKKTQPLRALAMGVGSLANGTSDSHALRTSGRATLIEILRFDWSESETLVS